MNRNMRRITIAVLIFSLCLSLIGCGINNNESDQIDYDEKVTLKFTWWGNDNRKDLTMQMIELYENQNPNVKIEAEVVSNTSEIATKLAIDTANQTMPDIIQGDYNFIYNYINRDLIEPLTTYSEGNLLNLTDIDENYLVPGMKNNILYALPIGINSQAFGYNEKLFEEAGVAVPTEGYTLDTLHNTLIALKENIDTPDFYPLGNMIEIAYFLRAKGVSLYNPNGTALGYEDDGIMAEYLSLMNKWRSEGLLNPDSLGTGVNENHPLVTGQVAMFSVSSNAVGPLSDLSGENINLLPYPVMDAQYEGKYIKPAMFLAMSSYSKHKEEAAKFIDFFINNEAANDILNGERGVPVSSKIATRLSDKLDDSGKEQYTYLEYVKSNSTPIDAPNPSNHVVLNKAFELIVSQVSEGLITAEQGAKQYREKAMEYLTGEEKETL